VELLHQGEIGKVGTEQHTNHTSIADAERLLTKDAERFFNNMRKDWSWMQHCCQNACKSAR